MALGLAALAGPIPSAASPGALERISVNDAEASGNSVSVDAEISFDGQYVAFGSASSNLPGAGGRYPGGLFLRDRQGGVTQRMDVDLTGGPPNDTFSVGRPVSDDGRFVAFSSSAGDIVTADSNGNTDVFLRDMQVGVSERVSVDGDEYQLGAGFAPTMNADATVIAFQGPGGRTFVRDLSAGKTMALQAIGGVSAADPSISRDGRFVAYQMYDVGLSLHQILVVDVLLGATEAASTSAGGTLANADAFSPAISGDGRYVTFHTSASNLVVGDTNGWPDVFVKDLQTGSMERVSVNSSGAQATAGQSEFGSISADGRYVAFESRANGLAGGDPPGTWDMFVRDRLLATTERVIELDGYGPRGGISGNGGFVVFEGNSSLSPGGTLPNPDIYTIELAYDGDSDGVTNAGDNCPSVANPAQTDSDADGQGDMCDNCPTSTNAGQADFDGSGGGDVCDLDDDNDGVPDATDDCRTTANLSQSNGDGDSAGDACDNCPATSNDSQADFDAMAGGDACDSDDDEDTAPDTTDNCPREQNPGQENSDGDSEGDACDTDSDNDWLANNVDPCPLLADCDSDGLSDIGDNCPVHANPTQTDSDGDTLGDPCEPCAPNPSACIDKIMVDVEDDGVPANTPTQVGSIEACRSMYNNDLLDGDEDAVDEIALDVVVAPNGVPVSAPMVAFQFGLHYDPADVTVTAVAVSQLLAANAGSSIFDASEPVPDTDGEFAVVALDIGGGAPESGDGVLARVTLRAEAMDVRYSTFFLDNYASIDSGGSVTDIVSAQAGAAAINASCSTVDVDGDSIPFPPDNCPSSFNPDQADNEGDGVGNVCDLDDDNAGVLDFDEIACGADAHVAELRPERVDGVFAEFDDNGNGWIDEVLPTGSGDNDCDGDGYTGNAEVHVLASTNVRDQDACGTDGWPADLIGGAFSGNKVNVQDLATFLGPVRHLGTDVGDNPGNVRWDVVPGAGVLPDDINIIDMANIVALKPPMLGGVKALNGPLCPWPP